MFAEHGIVVKIEDAQQFVGTGEDSSISGIGRANGFEVDIERDKARTYEIYEQITMGKLKPLPGTIQFVKDCQVKGLKLAVASSADRIKVLINLREIELSPDNFQAIVNGQDVERKKPFPDVFILAAERLGLKPEECLVIVDAGKAAGAKCLALTTSFPAEKLTQADWICENLEHVPDNALSW